MSGIDMTATASTSATGAITRVGSARTSPVWKPKVSAIIKPIVATTPTTMPGRGKREPSVITGIASSAIAGMAKLPTSASAVAMTSCAPSQPASITYSGLEERNMRMSARA